MDSSVSVENRKRMFMAAYAIYLFSVILFSSKYAEMSQLNMLFPLIRVTAYFLVFSKLLLDFFSRGFSAKEIVIAGMVSVLLTVIAYISKDKNMLIYWAFIVAAHDVEFDKVIKCSLWVHLAGLLLVIGSSYLHILENRIYYQDGGNRIRESLGFQYTTESSNYFFYTILLWVYCRKEKITWKEIIAMLCISEFLFLKTDTKNSFLLGLAAIAAAAALKHVVWLRRFKKLYSVIVVGIVPTLAFVIIGLSVAFDSSILWMNKINDFVTGRLALAKDGYLKYGVHLLGQHIEWIGGTPPEGKIYNYVDSSYMQILLNFGIIFFTLLISGLVVLGIYITVSRDTYFCLVFIIFAVHSTLDPQLIWIGYNSFIIAYSYVLVSERKRKNESSTAEYSAANG